jgi:hypothetical protein
MKCLAILCLLLVLGAVVQIVSFPLHVNAGLKAGRRTQSTRTFDGFLLNSHQNDKEVGPTENDRAQGGLGGTDTAHAQQEIGESLLEKTVQEAVSNLVRKVETEGKFNEDGTAKLSPEQAFAEIYRKIKEESRRQNEEGAANGSSSSSTLEQQQEKAAEMLESLFGGEQARDPFDERAVMMKLKNMLNLEDFKELFIDPKIGDYL